MRATTLVYLAVGLAAACPNVPPPQARPHPSARRRERLARQFSHARKGRR